MGVWCKYACVFCAPRDTAEGVSCIHTQYEPLRILVRVRCSNLTKMPKQKCQKTQNGQPVILIWRDPPPDKTKSLLEPARNIFRATPSLDETSRPIGRCVGSRTVVIIPFSVLGQAPSTPSSTALSRRRGVKLR